MLRSAVGMRKHSIEIMRWDEYNVDLFNLPFLERRALRGRLVRSLVSSRTGSPADNFAHAIGELLDVGNFLCRRLNDLVKVSSLLGAMIRSCRFPVKLSRACRFRRYVRPRGPFT